MEAKKNLQSEEVLKDAAADNIPESDELNEINQLSAHDTSSNLSDYGTVRQKKISCAQQFLSLCSKIIRALQNFLYNHHYHFDDILNIVRPFVYVFTVMKYGHKSYTPIKVSLTIDIISIFVSISRLIKS